MDTPRTHRQDADVPADGREQLELSRETISDLDAPAEEVRGGALWTGTGVSLNCTVSIVACVTTKNA